MSKATTQEREMNYRGESFEIGQNVTRINFDGEIIGGDYAITSETFHSVGYRTLSVMVRDANGGYTQALPIDNITAA